jgi:hypothetical protein
MRKTVAVLVSVALSALIGVGAAQADRGPGNPGRGGCPAAHSHVNGHGHGRSHSRAHARCSTPPTFDEVTTTTESAPTTSEDTSTTQVG